MKKMILFFCLLPAICSAELKPDDFESRATGRSVREYLRAKQKAADDFTDAKDKAAESYEAEVQKLRAELLADLRKHLKAAIEKDELKESLRLQMAIAKLEENNVEPPTGQEFLQGVWEINWLNHPSSCFQSFQQSGRGMLIERRQSMNGETLQKGPAIMVQGKVAFKYLKGARLDVYTPTSDGRLYVEQWDLSIDKAATGKPMIHGIAKKVKQ